MKNLLLLLLVFITISCSCNMQEWYINPWDIDSSDISKLPNFKTFIENPNTSISKKIQYFQEYIDKNIKYKLPENIFNIQFPQETLDKRSGECKAKAVLLIALCYKYLNIKGNYVGLHKEGELIGHVVMAYNGYYYNSTNSSILKIKDSNYIISIYVYFNELSDYINYNNSTYH